MHTDIIQYVDIILYSSLQFWGYFNQLELAEKLFWLSESCGLYYIQYYIIYIYMLSRFFCWFSIFVDFWFLVRLDCERRSELCVSLWRWKWKLFEAVLYIIIFTETLYWDISIPGQSNCMHKLFYAVIINNVHSIYRSAITAMHVTV